MWACAQVDEVAAPVGRDFHVVSDLAANQLHLEWVRLKELQCLSLRQDQAFEVLLLLHDFLGACLDGGVVFIRDVLQNIYKKLRKELTSFPE